MTEPTVTATPTLRRDLNVGTTWSLPAGAPARTATDLRLGFAPELLPPEVGHARLVPGPDGEPEEERDRWAGPRAHRDRDRVLRRRTPRK